MRSEGVPEISEESYKSWTDDLPVCVQTGAGFATNQHYREDGTRQESYKFRDRSFYCKIDENTYLYGLFSGHNGVKVVDMALQRLAAEILLGQLNDKNSESEIKEVLRQAFEAVEKCYLDSIDTLLAKKTALECEIPEGLTELEISHNYQHVLNELKTINYELAIGCSIVLCLIYKGMLYVANVGNCRALLCKTDKNNVTTVTQVSVEHNLTNEDEILRLCQLGLDIQTLKQSPLEITRCIGCYLVKGGYTHSEYLSAASSDPVISQPEIFGGIPVDNTLRFLILMSSGLCKSLEEICSKEIQKENTEIIQMIVEQFRLQSTIMGVAQSVVHKIVQLHHDSYMRQQQKGRETRFSDREDVTMLVRNLNFPMPNAIGNSVAEENNVPRGTVRNSELTNSDYSHSTTSVCSSVQDRRPLHIFDKNRKIASYVDFRPYFENLEIAKENGTLPEGYDFE